MLASILILGSGEELWIRFVPQYLEFLGASAFVISIYGALKDLLDAIYQYPGGWLADRIGRKYSLILFTVLAAAGYFIYLFSDHWFWILAGTLFVMAWSSLTLPALFAIIGDNLPSEKRALGFGLQSILKRIPIVIAPVIGGWIITTSGIEQGVKIGLIITIALAAFSAFVIHRYYKETGTSGKDDVKIRGIWRELDPGLKKLLVSDILARWAEGIPKVFIVLYVMNVLKQDALTFGWLTGVSTVTAIILYLPVSKISDRYNRRPFILATFLFFALFPLSMTFATGFWSLAIAFIFAGLREFGETSRKAMIVDLSREAARGRAVGVYYLVRGLAVFPASLAGGLLWKMNVNLPFYIAFVVGMAGVLFYSISSRPKTS